MPAVKGFVVLAVVLLIPSIGYFHKQHFLNHLKPGLEAQVKDVLEAEGVVAPVVHLDYLDAVISGRVDSNEERARVIATVDALAGVRMTGKGKRLHTYGWLRIERRRGRFTATGVVSGGLAVRLPDPLEMMEGWDDGLERRKIVEDPGGIRDWGEFLLYYFGEPGDRSVKLQMGGLTMRGDATTGLRSDWLSKASEVVSKDMVVADFNLRPSVCHFPGYQPLSLTDEAVLEQLWRQLDSNVVTFRPGSEQLLSADRDKVILAARAIITAGEKGLYVVGGHPARDGNATANSQLARLRAEVVAKILVDHGVAAGQIEIVSFSVASEGDRDNQVEIVVK
ncbi:MAG: hypothetical protein CMN05_11360 [Roseibacillus sp.]|jgi:outer membrane protein OmpA-like peptidoglycan-associated protein|nr:hypothetical protein [Roseibacillus sp.]MBP36382.1 hypothetical protein [Roseibacillus sp.]MCP4730897.1 OmpA family protein [Roseibacillus sp.]MDP7306112.1 OmpA family protein [Roseibacillus sp.]MDP7654460.1 OmpA family protein [Roseibacillus sp.]|tara:strand:+ start:16948 stop:17958 length:1011 start_codon:yes stop_codon:yes gene_type:complete